MNSSDDLSKLGRKFYKYRESQALAGILTSASLSTLAAVLALSDRGYLREGLLIVATLNGWRAIQQFIVLNRAGYLPRTWILVCESSDCGKPFSVTGATDGAFAEHESVECPHCGWTYWKWRETTGNTFSVRPLTPDEEAEWLSR